VYIKHIKSTNMATMKLGDLLTDESILAELGERLSHQRVMRGLTQADLAKAAGVAKRTVERVEAGESIQLVTLVRICRVLELVSGLDQLVPEKTLSPMALLKEKSRNKTPQRVRGGTKAPLKPGKAADWRWGEEQ
jgi:transcriptional regulator with XRE-family HTH domain